MKTLPLFGLLIIAILCLNCKNNQASQEFLNKENSENAIEKETVVDKTNKESGTAAKSDRWDHIPQRYVIMKNPTYVTTKNLAIGKALYSKHCKSCHGKTGIGDGPNAGEFTSDIGDFSSKIFHNQSEGTIFYKSYIGHNDMPNYEKEIPDPMDMWLIVNYMRTLEE